MECSEVKYSCKALAKWTRKSMQVDASLQNQNLRTDLRWAAKQFGSQVQASCKKAVNFTHIQLTCDQLVSICIGWPNGEKRIELDQSQRAPVHAHPCKPNKTQVTCLDLRVRSARA